MNRGEELDWLREGARSFDLTLETAQADALLQLVDELERANADFNLTAIRDRPGMLTKHVLDSLSVQPHLRGVRIADVGTGAGIPICGFESGFEGCRGRPGRQIGEFRGAIH